MKLVIYGISCAGKDTFINQFTKRFFSFSHIKGSSALEEFSNKKYKTQFELLDLEKQHQIRKDFIHKIKNTDEIIVDGHYCFPKEDSYEIVFTEADKEIYDILIYLRANPKSVKERISISEKNKKYTSLTVEEIEKWQEKEISELRDICFNEQKEFIILDDDFDSCLSFFEEYFSSYPNMTSLEISKRIVDEIIFSNLDNKKIALVDCDRTVVKEDTTIPFFEINNESTRILKQIFYGDVYSIYQFWRQQQIYKNFSKYPEVKIHINQEVLNKIENLKENGYMICGFTAGIFKIWNDINNEYQLFDKVIGSNLMENPVGIISDFAKGYTVKLLQKNGYTVFSTGDSLCDIYMLESCGGYIWSPEKIRPAVQTYIENHKHTSIKQYKNNPTKYVGIDEAE